MKIFVDGHGTDWSHADDSICLSADRWNDYSFITQFGMSVRLKDGSITQVGAVKIGFKGQTLALDTHQKLPQGHFGPLDSEFFSVGQDVSYYEALAKLPADKGREVLEALRDVVATPAILTEASSETVFNKSLLRTVSLTSIKGQFSRAMKGLPKQTPFKFKFVRPATHERSAVDLTFKVKVASRPSTNIHALIGRNGIGKTTLLNGMIDAIAGTKQAGEFRDLESGDAPIDSGYFSRLVSVSFSAFDPFTPPLDQPDPSKGTCYHYIGLKSTESDRHLTIPELHSDCIAALIQCLRHSKKRVRWLEAIDKLSSDENFERMLLKQFAEIFDDLLESTTAEEELSQRFITSVQPRIAQMSSGHAIILLTMTRLVATIEEKTLVILDEPESHLHPPLLSAFIRALSDLLLDLNCVAIIATHSPVVLQEIPAACVWKFDRFGDSLSTRRPSIETFAENVGQLTSEVFNLEVRQSGFHAMLQHDVETGGSYEEIVDSYADQLGVEGRTILGILIAARDRKKANS